VDIICLQHEFGIFGGPEGRYITELLKGLRKPVVTTLYQAQEQIVSGTLAYAVGIGKAVVSTPYLYAEESLADGRGQIVPFDDAPELARTLIALIENEVEQHRMRKLAYAYGQQMIWPKVAEGYQALFELVIMAYRQQFLARPVHKLI
jgi:glycosyltransferase involved in cell wall biosynthesis